MTVAGWRFPVALHAVAIAAHYGATIAALFVVPPATALIPTADLGPDPLFVFTQLANHFNTCLSFLRRARSRVSLGATCCARHVFFLSL